MKIDDRDRQILALLQDNARRSNASLARDLGVSEATVRRRINTLIDESVVSVKAVPNSKKLGLVTSALIGIDVAPGHGAMVTAALNAREEVVLLGTTAGRYDVVARVLVKDLDELQKFLGEFLTKIDGVQKTETLILLDVKKEWLGG